MSNVIDIRTRKTIEIKEVNFNDMDIGSLMKELIQFKDELVSSGRVTKEQALKGLPLLEAIIVKSTDTTMKAWANICHTEMKRILNK